MITRSVLIIDDEEDIRAVAQVSLELVGGYKVLTASSGSEGIRTAVAERPDLILLDVMMPTMDGQATFLALRENEVTREIPVVLLTAKVQPADWRRFAELRVTGVIPKPFDPLKLPAQVASAAGWTS